MCRHGSVLVVVLGLLAILSVIGVAFITMSGLDRSTSASFAMQTQLTIAADGAVDYVCHYLVHDVWTDDGALLTGEEGCERYDYPGDEDNWLARPVGDTTSPNEVSFGKPTKPLLFGIESGGNSAVVDNDGDGTDDGIWIPELAAPFDQYIVRISVTVLDHGALLNVNAHGYTSAGWEEYANLAAEDKGCFICEIAGPPGVAAARWAGRYLDGTSGQWVSVDDGPGNPVMGETIIENPRNPRMEPDNLDQPFTLAEEFLLRVRDLPDFNSRLSAGVKTNAEKYTTVSWTAEVCGDAGTTSHTKCPGKDWSCPKADLNLDEPQAIYDVLLASGAFVGVSEDGLKQFVANIIAFRDADSTYDNDYDGFAGAESQPIFKEVKAVVTAGDGETEDTTWTITVSLYNPWPGDYAGDLDGRITLQPEAKVTLVFDDGTEEMSGLPATMAKGETTDPPLTGTVTCKVTGEGEDAKVQDLSDRLTAIRFHAEVTEVGDVVMDEITSDEILSLALAPGISRVRKIDDSPPDWRGFTVVTVGDWGTQGQGNVPSGTVLVRFANSVQDEYDAATEGGPLPPLKTAGNNSFKAFLRVGDLNQVLCPQPAEGGWKNRPWVLQVTDHAEADIRFNWARYPRAADALCVQGPWIDGFDNDGDGQTDLDDEGTFDAGRFAGPEFRVAGKINLNTATNATLAALPGGGVPAFTPPLSSIAEIIPTGGSGSLEQRDEVFTRLSNLVTVRSDVFSIYGTVQIIDLAKVPSGGIVAQDDPAVVRSRRFWALVDRSPSLAYPPGDEKFIHPRIMNFQWME
ncbi:MAG TPA: hypothetical protein VM219_06100 [Phycisphaerae bacterium]|nr:hypothetical protein [Phycisphaerae bacterium]